jgi:chemotaxis protein CheC
MPSRSLIEQTALFARAADEASASLSKWLGRRTRISITGLRTLPLEEAVGVLGSADAPLVACAMRIHGDLDGVLLLACDDTSGLALADLLLDRGGGGSQSWGEVEISALVETANIIGCGYLNALAQADGGQPLLPSPPAFARDYTAAVMQAVMMSRSRPTDTVFLTHTEFLIEDAPITCSLLLIPEAPTAV